MSHSELFEHFSILIDTPHTQHQEYMAQHIHDAALLAQLKALLAQHFSTQAHTQWHDLIAQHAHTVTGDDQLQQLLGTQLGVYTLTKVIGEGGMGMVFLAERHDDLIDQQVAIKFFNPSIMRVVGDNLARNQAQVLAQLNHPNITYVYDTGITPSGLHYVVMEYVKGVPIDQYCREKKLTFNERIRLFLSLCDAIYKTHLIDIAHSDIKPANILVNEDGVAKILDFDIAKVLQHSNTESHHDSVKRYLRALSLAYASPEQLKGETLTLSTDQYSLGVLLFVLLTNNHPFDVVNKPIEQLVEDIDAGNTQKFITTDILSLNLQHRWFVLSDIQAIIKKAMSVDVAARYSSVGEFKSDIYKALNYFPTQVRSNPIDRVKKWLARNPIICVGTSLICIATVCLFIQNKSLSYSHGGLGAEHYLHSNDRQTAVKVLSDNDKVQLFYDIAHALYVHQQYSQAITVLETALAHPQYLQQDKTEHNAKLSRLLVACYEQNGQPGKAEQLKSKLQHLSSGL